MREGIEGDGTASGAWTNGRAHTGGKLVDKVLSLRQCAAQPPRRYLIKGLICAEDLAVMVGHPGSGKSVFGPHLALAVAQGRSVLGRRVHAGRVLYIAAEDGTGMAHRAHAHLLRYGDTENFRLVIVPLDLLTLDSPDLAELIAYIESYRPVLIVIDTLARSFPGLRENESEDVGLMVGVIRDRLCEPCGSAVLALAHIAKDGGSTPRGHGLLNGDADLVMIVEGAAGEMRTVRLGKNRAGPSDATFAFNIARVELGTDEDGDPITAPLCEEVEVLPGDLSAAREARLQDRALMLLREIRDLIAVAGEPVSPAMGMADAVCVTRQVLRRRLIGSG